MVAYQGPGAPSRLAKLTPWLTRYGPHLRHLLLQNRDPHLAVWINVAGLISEVPSAAFFADLQAALESRKDEK
jgi:hypothetical protein